MEKNAPTCRAVLVSLVVLVLCGVLVPTACVVPPPGPCTGASDCDDGLYCNGAETCVNGACVDGTSPCTEGQTCDDENDVCVVEGCLSDADCADDEFCDTATGECVVNENLFAVIALDKADVGGNFDTVHPLHTNCTVCHHADPAAGFQSCRTAGCHDDDPNGPNSFKDAAHDQDESGDGCRACHAAEFDNNNCAFCHILLATP